MPKFIVVSGEPRSGTSMMMQTLNLLGLNIWQNDETRNKSKDDTYLKHAQKLNPKGFFETQFVVRGINLERMKKNAENKDNFENILEQHNGEVVKIVTRGLLNTSSELIDKIIFCARSPRSIAYSQTELTSTVMVASNKGDWEFPILDYNPLNYIIDISRLLKNIDKYKDKMTVVKYNDMHNNAEETIKSIISFLNLIPTEKQINSAIKNVDPNLNRKSNPPNIPGKEWEIAEKLYEKLIKKEIMNIELENEITEYMQQIRKEKISWLEESIWNRCDIGLYKKLQTDKKTRKILMTNAEKRRIRGLTCVSCEHYNRNGSSYTVERNEIGNLTRNKVRCNSLNQEVTLEKCQSHWSQIRDN